jgi:hypothetical protein
MNRKSTALAVLFCFVIPVRAQVQDRPMPDRWRGLIIDESSPDDAIKTLGAPATDKNLFSGHCIAVLRKSDS